MKKLGLALSGGGFRATLYHLGLVRFLRDANILQHVSHITAVSGGSIMAAHLGLNWDRYTGSEKEFDEAASELLNFARLDVRNRILRRYGLGIILRLPRRLVGLSNRRLTRTGLLAEMYRAHLFGDTNLFQLPESPSLHLLATNLSEGRLCSFNREGMLAIRPGAGGAFEVDRNSAGLTTLSLAVAASSAFPGFFPPLVLTGDDVGANKAEFGRQAFTDGGVFDNLGVRMFRFLEQSLGKDGFPWDKVLVSDVGRQFEMMSSTGTPGLIRTAMRASDILMNRVWQLENEAVLDSTGFIFARVTDTVEPHEDPTAPHPEIQRHLPSIRTDFDRFSSIEIRNLISHGYCVARKACRTAPEMFGKDLPDNPPWDPLSKPSDPATTTPEATTVRVRRKGTTVAQDARALHASAGRRIWSTMLDYRDWVSYLYVPILVPIVFILPSISYHYYKRFVRLNTLTLSYAQGSPDLAQLDRMLDAEPMKPWKGVPVEEGRTGSTSANGFKVLSDSRITDLRAWNPATAGVANSESRVYVYRRLSVIKLPEHLGPPLFPVRLILAGDLGEVRLPPQALPAKVVKTLLNEEKRYRWEVVFDFAKAPAGAPMDLLVEIQSPGLFLRGSEASSGMGFAIEAETAELLQWILMPKGRRYGNFRYIRYKKDQPGSAEDKRFVNQYLAKDHSMLAFKLLSLDPGYEHEISWRYE